MTGALTTVIESLKGRVMGPLLALVCRCFRENVIGTCKIESLKGYSLDNFLLKNVLFCFVLFFSFLEIKSYHLKKKGLF